MRAKQDLRCVRLRYNLGGEGDECRNRDCRVASRFVWLATLGGLYRGTCNGVIAAPLSLRLSHCRAEASQCFQRRSDPAEDHWCFPQRLEEADFGVASRGIPAAVFLFAGQLPYRK
jgi:hypothetical protein